MPEQMLESSVLVRIATIAACLLLSTPIWAERNYIKPHAGINIVQVNDLGQPALLAPAPMAMAATMTNSHRSGIRINVLDGPLGDLGLSEACGFTHVHDDRMTVIIS